MNQFRKYKLLRAKKDTLLKKSPVDSSSLSSSQKEFLNSGQERPISEIEKINDHYKITINGEKWFVWSQDVDLI